MDRQRLIVFGILGVSLIFLIAGAVMLGVGIHKANKKQTCPSCPAAPTVSPTTVDLSNVTAVYASTRHQNLNWSDDLKDPNSAYFQAMAQNVSNTISNVLGGSASFGRIFLAAKAPGRVIVHMFTQETSGSVDAYTTMLFSTTITSQDLTDISTSLNAALNGASVYATPVQQCNGGPIVPPNSNPVTTTTVPAPTTSVGPTTTTPQGQTTTLPGGAWCDASGKNESTVFIIDISVPIYGNLSTKLTLIQNYLMMVDLNANLPKTGSWGNNNFYLILYCEFGYLPLSGPISDRVTWADQVNKLSSAVRSQTCDERNLPVALERAETLGMQLPSNNARSMVIVTDGFNMNFAINSTTIAERLKTNLYYQINVLSVSMSPEGQNILQTIANDRSRFYHLTDFTWLANRGIQAATSYWICNAYYPTPAPPTTPPTPVPLELSTTGPAQTTQFVPTTTTPLVNCPVDLLFLIDESQSMLSEWFEPALTFAVNTAQSYLSYQGDVQFALITFNDIIRYSSFNSGGFYNITELQKAVQNINENTNTANFSLGFTEARKIIENYGRQWVNGSTALPLIIFITDGDHLDNQMTNVELITAELKNKYNAEILALGMNPRAGRDAQIQTVIGYPWFGQNGTARYVRTNTVQQLMSTTITDIINNTVCAPQPIPQTCYTDITFIIEASYVQSDYIESELYAVYFTAQNFAAKVSSLQTRLSFIHFSSPNKTSIDLQQSIDAENFAQRVLAMIGNTTSGGASDLKGAFEKASQVVNSNSIGNSQLVVLIARGIYIDGHSINCCSDPYPAAQALMQNATVQGVLYGQYVNATELQALTNLPIINANSIVNETYSDRDNGQAIAQTLIPTINSVIANLSCTPVPQYPPPCYEFIDVTIAFHGSTSSNVKNITDFLSQSLLPAFFQGSLSDVSLTKNAPINIALLTMGGTTVNTVADFSQLNSPQSYATLIQNASIADYSPPEISRVYDTVGIIRNYAGRSYASTIVIIVTDSFAADDQRDQDSLDDLSPAFAQGIQIGFSTPSLIVTSNPIVIPDISQLNPHDIRASRPIANTLAQLACQQLTTTSTPRITTTPTTPPPPKAKARVVYPDITILIDTSSGISAMNDLGFQMIQKFVTQYFLDELWIADYASRIAIATFDKSLTVLCYYSDIHSYYDLQNCIQNKLVYGLNQQYSATRDLTTALNQLQTKVFNSNAGYIPAKENFLLILTTGSSSTDASAALQAINRNGVRTLGINLGGQMSVSELSTYGVDSYALANWMDTTTGLLSTNSYQLIDFLTNKHRIPLPNFYADFYFVIDASQANSEFTNVPAFIQSFVNLLNLSPYRSGISVIPYNDNTVQTLAYTQNLDDFNTWFSTFKTLQPSGGANVGAAINSIQIQANNNRLSHIIYIVQSPSANGTDQAKKFNNLANVKQFVLQTNALATYASVLSSQVYGLVDAANLNNWIGNKINDSTNQMGPFFSDLSSSQETFSSTNTMLLSQVQADISFVIDISGFSNAAAFTAFKTYLVDFIKQFDVSPIGTQFAIQLFGVKDEAHDGFHFNDYNNATTLTNLINNNLTWAITGADATVDLSGTLDQVSNFFYVPANGWRSGPSYVVMLTAATQFDHEKDQDALKLKKKASVFAIGTETEAAQDYVAQFTSSGSASFKLIASLTDLTNQSTQDIALKNDIANYYKAIMYPVMPNLADVEADYIFLLDHNSALGATAFAAVIQYLIDFTTNVYNAKSRVGLISYGPNIIPDQSFSLSNYNSGELIIKIQALKYQNIQTSSDLVTAIEYFLNNATYGYNSNRLTFVIDIASSSVITRAIRSDITRNLNIAAFTYAYGAQTLIYIADFLGPYGSKHWNAGYTFNAVDDQLKSYIKNSYAAWLTTSS